MRVLPSGYIVAKAVNYRNPVKVQVIPSFEEHSRLRSEENVTNEEIKTHMDRVLRANPRFAEGLEYPSKSQPRALLIGVNCNLNMHVLHHIFVLSQTEPWKKINRILVKHAKNGDPMLGALTVLKITEKLVVEEDDLSTHCDFFVWFLSQMIPENAKEYELIREELIRQQGLDCTITRFENTSLDWFYKRMNIEARKRFDENRIDTSKLRSLLKKTLRSAKTEYDRQVIAMEEAGIDHHKIKTITELEGKLEELTSEDRFSENFTHVLEQARVGNFKPLAVMMDELTDSITPAHIDRYEVAECLIDYGLQKYGTPSDSELVHGILLEVKAEMAA